MLAILPILILTSAVGAASADQPPSISWLDAVQFNNAARDRSAWRGVETQLKAAVEESGWSWLPTSPEPRPSKDCESSIACLLKHAKASGAQYLLVTAGGYSANQRLTDFSGSVRLFHVKDGFVSEEQPIECIVCGQSSLVQQLQARAKALFFTEQQRLRTAVATAQPREPQTENRPKAVVPPAVIAGPAPIPSPPSANGSNIVAWSSLAVGAVSLGLGIHWISINNNRSNDCNVQARTCDVYSTGGLGWGSAIGGVALMGTGLYLLKFHNDAANVSLQLSPQGGAIKGTF